MKLKLTVAIFSLFAIMSNVYAMDKNSVEGYWVQYDEDDDNGKGMPQGIVQSYLEKNGTLSVKIVVPLMDVNASGNPQAPMLHCDKCGKGSKNGFNYNYTDPKTNYLQGLVFTGNMQKQNDKYYDNGGVLNPKDGKTYNSKVELKDGGDTLEARAYLGWFGKTAHWKRIDKETYEKVLKECGLNENKEYPYVDKNGKITDKALYDKCTNYPFDVKSPV